MSDIEPFRSDHVEMVAMPNGTHVFELEVQATSRWKKHRGMVRFPTKLKDTPSDIVFSNVIMDGVSNLVVTKITKNGFWFMIQSTTTIIQNWTTTISFDWEAIV